MTQIFANIKKLVTRFSVVQDGIEVSLWRREEEFGGESLLMLACKNIWRILIQFDLDKSSSQRLKEYISRYTRESSRRGGQCRAELRYTKIIFDQ